MSDCPGLRVLDPASTTFDPFMQAHCPGCTECAQLRAQLAQALAWIGNDGHRGSCAVHDWTRVSGYEKAGECDCGFTALRAGLADLDAKEQP